VVKNWVKEETSYDLGGGYFLQKADTDVFVKYLVIYSSRNQWLFNDFNGFVKDMKNMNEEQLNSLFWIYQNNKRVGGVMVSPNMVVYPFFIPPFESRYTVFDKLNKAMSVWSDPNKQIMIYNVTEEEKKIFVSLGYKISSERCAMIKPTDKYCIEFEKDIKVTNLAEAYNEETVEKLARFFCEAHIGSVDDRGASDEAVKSKLNMLKYFFNLFDENKTLDCSCFLTVRDKIIGACIVGKDDEQQPYGYAAIVDVAVLPQYRGRGLAGKMIDYSISKASKYSAAVYLGVTIGNDAQSLYIKKGFISGITLTSLFR
jgi:ribosomal protein S18 acetylase RimI-like enzyme